MFMIQLLLHIDTTFVAVTKNHTSDRIEDGGSCACTSAQKKLYVL